MGTELHRRRLPGLLSLASLASVMLSPSVGHAQLVTTPNGSVTIDYGVLNSLGQPLTPSAGTYGQPSYPYGQPGNPYGQANGQQPYPYGQPAYGYPAQAAAPAYGQLLYPPPQYPVSSLLVPQPPGSLPYVARPAAAQPAAASTAGTANESAGNAAATSGMASSQPEGPPETPAAVAEAPASGTSAEAGTPPPPPTPAPPASAAAASTSAPAVTPPAASETTTAAAGPTNPPPAPGATSSGEVPPAAPASGDAATASGADTGAPAIAPPAPPPAEGTGTAAASGAATGTEATASIAPPAPEPAAGAPANGTAASGTGATQTAAIPPTAATEGQIHIVFPVDSADIPDKDKAELDTLAQKMNTDENMRLQLLAYASGTADEASRARRMSLSRALAVRSYLIKQGVRSTRMDVRALGNNVQGTPADRVDIIPKAQ